MAILLMTTNQARQCIPVNGVTFTIGEMQALIGFEADGAGGYRSACDAIEPLEIPHRNLIIVIDKLGGRKRLPRNLLARNTARCEIRGNALLMSEQEFGRAADSTWIHGPPQKYHIPAGLHEPHQVILP